MNLNFADIVPSFPFILQGIFVTLKIAALACIFGFLIGTLLAVFKISKYKGLSIFASFYTSIFRGTPLIVQLMIIYYGSPQMLGYQIEGYWAAVLTFSLNSGAYISEIIRGGILAIDKGQSEAAQALGVSDGQMMIDIILPQAYKNILPSLMNEFITLTKESAVVTVIGVMDIMRRAFQVGGEKFAFLEPLLFAALIYYVLVMILTFFGKLLERRLRQSD